MDSFELKDFKLRRASVNDIDLLYEWANDSLTRKNAFYTDTIPYSDHIKWFNRVICDPEKIQMILEKSNIPIGQIRVDIENGIGVIDYSIAPEYRGKGYGKVICELMVRYIRKNVQVKKLIAQVKPDNESSKRCFAYNGFNSVFEQYELILEEK